MFGAPLSDTTVHTSAGLYLDSESTITDHISGTILKQSSQTFILSFQQHLHPHGPSSPSASLSLALFPFNL